MLGFVPVVKSSAASLKPARGERVKSPHRAEGKNALARGALPRRFGEGRFELGFVLTDVRNITHYLHPEFWTY